MEGHVASCSVIRADTNRKGWYPKVNTTKRVLQCHMEERKMPYLLLICGKQDDYDQITTEQDLLDIKKKYLLSYKQSSNNIHKKQLRKE